MGNYCNSMCPTSIYCIFRGLMHANRKVVSSSLGPAGIGGGGCSLLLQYHDWSGLEQGTEPPTAPRAPQHKWLPNATKVISTV